MSDNLKLWESVEKTDPKHTKKANVKGNQLTSIKPQYQIYNATKQWGSYGHKWGFKNIQLGYELKDVGLVTFKALFYYPDGEFEILNTISIYRDNAKTKLDDEFAKKVETDSLTKALSKLGFNADVFMGRFDDLRYVDEMDIAYGNKVDPKQLEAKAIEEMKSTKTKAEITTVWNKYPSFHANTTEFYKITADQSRKIK
jgi:hypothetical protein